MATKHRKIKAVVIGCGRIGAQEELYSADIQPATHAGAFAANSDIDLVALVDNDRTKLAAAGKRFQGVELYADAEKALTEHKPDIVSISTPTESHQKFVLLAARHKCKVIFCEKPIAYSLSEAKKMVTACQRSGSQLFINHQRRFDPLLQKWATRIRKGFLGRIYEANAYYYNGIFNNGTHLVDLLRMFLGEPILINAYHNRATSAAGGRENIDGLLVFGGDIPTTVQSLSDNYGYFGIQIFGEKGILTINNFGFTIEFRKKVKSKKYHNYFEISPSIFQEGKPRSMIASAISHLTAFARGKVKAIGTGADAIKTLNVLLEMKKLSDRKNYV